MQDLFVGNISFDATEEDVRDLFEDFGAVKRVKFISGRESGKFRGFGFVTMENDADADKAIKALHGRDLMGRDLTVRVAQDRQPSNQGWPQGDFQNRRPHGDDRGGARRRERGSVTQSVVSFFLFISLLALFGGVAFRFSQWRCDRVGKAMGMGAQFQLFTGCMVDPKPGRWIPFSKYRYTGD